MVESLAPTTGLTFPRSKGELQELGLHTTWLTIETLLEAWTGNYSPDWSVLNGANVLDIGAGSYLNGDHGAPWFARVCAVNGARVVVTDILPQSEVDIKLFEAIIDEDIIPPVLAGQFAQLPQLQGRTFDIIHSMNLVGFNPDPRLEGALNNLGVRLSEFEESLVRQTRALLNTGGVMYLGQLYGGVYRKS